MFRPISLFRAAVFLSVCATCLLGESTARAGYIVTFQQTGSNVVATGSGSLNTAALTAGSSSILNPNVDPSSDDAVVGPTNASTFAQFDGSLTGPLDFGSGGFVYATSGSGDLVGLSQPITVFHGGVTFDGEPVSNLAILVPIGYVSGSSLSDTSTWAGQSLSSLGITPGTYTWTWGTGPTADSYTLVALVPVPEPASLTLLGSALFGLAALGLRRRPQEPQA